MNRLTSHNPLTERETMNLSLTRLYVRLKAYEDAAEQGRTVPVVRCRDCCYAPKGTDKGEERGIGLEWPEWMTNKCPLMCEDGWYSHKPEPDWYCANGKRKEKEPNV